MVIIPDILQAYIHIPRTSGTSLEKALKLAFETRVPRTPPGAPSGHGTYLQHCGDLPDYQFFTIMRDPWDWFRSLYTWQFEVVKPERREHITNDQLLWALDTTERTFDEFLAKCTEHNSYWLPGIWARYICSLDVKVFQFGPNARSEIGEYLGVDLQEFHVEQSTTGPPEWTQAAVDMVAALCGDDIHRFGYTPPTV